MIGQYKFWRENFYRGRCRLQVGSTFIFKGNYCEVITMRFNYFIYRKQQDGLTFTMSYEDYLKTPSAKARKL